MEMVIRKLEPHWRAQGKGFGMDGFFLSCVCYADDTVLAATSMEHMEEMIADVVAELKEIGLGVGPEKTHWTSTPPRASQQLHVMGETVDWEDSRKDFQKCRSILTCGWIPKERRMGLLPKTVMAMLLFFGSRAPGRRRRAIGIISQAGAQGERPRC
ncbi:unnamed protein product [Prorocentrum cordatum]|uniref:Reverse transcriptase domain-containing protein n=1 Tax=Prorocentrum cordatum TaxID=2364126 RepID=A0ABN9X1N8_9DINO|nr:unnamed protein product [Polarella glacialis]